MKLPSQKPMLSMIESATFHTKLPCQKPILSMIESATFQYEASLPKTNVKYD